MEPDSAQNPPPALTAPESFVLLNGPNASGAQAFKLGVMDLVARGALVMESEQQMLRDGAAASARSERALSRILDLYQRAPTQTYGGGDIGVRIDDLAKAAARQYGRLGGYVSQDVLPALEERGLYERKTGRILWIFPTTRWALTPSGDVERSRLLARRGDTSSDRGWDDASDVTTFIFLSEAYGGGGGGDFDFGALGFASMEAFDTALSAIDSAVDAVSSSFDGGSSSSDGGGWSDSGGGDSGSGGDSGGGGSTD